MIKTLTEVKVGDQILLDNPTYKPVAGVPVDELDSRDHGVCIAANDGTVDFAMGSGASLHLNATNYAQQMNEGHAEFIDETSERWTKIEPGVTSFLDGISRLGENASMDDLMNVFEGAIKKQNPK